MKKLLLFLLVIGIISAALPGKRGTFKTELKYHWKAKIGNTSYRTIPVESNGLIYIGSNGSHFRDYAIDDGNGVFALSASNGAQKIHFANDQFGDMDVNGILSYDGKFYFGNDNEEFLCVDALGAIQWRIPASGDIEHRPVQFNSGTEKTIAFATETGQIVAVDAKTGKERWSYYHQDFEGWKPGDNRTVFKVKMHFTEANIFFNEPSLVDLNGDAVQDLVYNTNWGGFIAISGNTGKMLWSIDREEESGFVSNMGREKPLIIGEGSKAQLMVMQWNRNDGSKDCIAFYNAKGKLIKRINANRDLGNSLISQTDGVFFTTTSILVPGKNPDDLKIIAIDSAFRKLDEGKIYPRYGDGQVALQKIRYNNEDCAVVLFQYDFLQNRGQSPLMLIGLNSGKVHVKAYLPASSEFTPVLRDFNKDGKIDALIGCYDGYLYCFDYGITTDHLID